MHVANTANHQIATQSVKHEKWGIFPQFIFWAYLFAVGTNLSPFPSDIDAYAIREASGSSLTRVYFLLLLALSLFAVVPVSALVATRIRQCAPMLLPLGFVLCIMFISTFLSPHMALGMRKLAFFVISNLTLILIMFTAPNLRSLIRSTGFFLAFLVLISLFGVFLIPERSIHQEFLYAGAWRGIFSHKNYTGATLCLAIYVFIICRQYGNRGFWLTMLILSLGFMIMTQSKTSLAGFILSPIIAYAVGSKKRLVRAPALYQSIGLVLSVGCALFFIYAAKLFIAMDITSTLTGRLPLWEILLRITSEHPIIGHGYETFFNQGTESALFTEGGTWSRFAAHAHNGYFNIYIYGGFLSLLGILWFLLALYNKAFTSLLHDHKIAFWIVSIIIFETIRNITEVDLFTGARITWSLTLVAGLVLMLIPAEKKVSFKATEI